MIEDIQKQRLEIVHQILSIVNIKDIPHQKTPLKNFPRYYKKAK